MTADAFKEMLLCNEPSFGYQGQEYSICCPDGKYYVTASDSPADIGLVFDSVDALLDRWMIQGKPLRLVLRDIEMD